MQKKTKKCLIDFLKLSNQYFNPRNDDFGTNKKNSKFCFKSDSFSKNLKLRQ